MVETAQSPAILTLSTPVRETGCALLVFLECQPARAVAYVTNPRAFAVGTLFKFFCHWIIPSLICSPACRAGSEGKSTCCDFPGAYALLSHDSVGISRLPSEKRAESPGAPPVRRPNP